MKLKFIYIFLFGLLFFAARAEAASLYVSPASGSFSVGSTFTVTVRTDTQGVSANTAEAGISYSNNLELVRVAQGSTFHLPAPGSPSKGSGSAYFGGGLPSPGYTGTAGAVGTLTFRALREGSANVSVVSGKVLLNDGSGTNALAGTAGARYTITPPAVGSPEISSTTHPDPDAWYAKRDVELSWSRPAGAHGFSFELDQKANTEPDSVLDTTQTTTKKYEGLQDGVWHFHIKTRREPANSPFGATAHFKIQIDTEVPKLFDIKLVGQTDLNDVTRTPTIEFAAEDPDGSGIDHYDVLLDGEVVQSPVTSPFTFSKLLSGPHRIRVVAYDRAGNLRKTELPVIITGPGSANLFSKTVTVPAIILVFLGLLMLVQSLLMLKMIKTLEDRP